MMNQNNQNAVAIALTSHFLCISLFVHSYSFFLFSGFSSLVSIRRGTVTTLSHALFVYIETIYRQISLVITVFQTSDSS